MQGTEVQVDIPGDVSPDGMKEIAKFIESQGAVAVAKVRVEKQGPDAPATMIMELWGDDLHGVDFEAPLRERFPALADARIARVDLGGEGPGAAEYGSDAADPEVAKQEIIDQMRADGVEGDIQVDVKDGPNGREVEVKVKKTEGDDQAAAPK